METKSHFNFFKTWGLIILLAGVQNILAQNVDSGAGNLDVQKNDTITTDMNKPSKVYNTIRLTTAPPRIDGVLNDACWETGEWAGDFIQWIPNEGAKPTYPTYLKILYDDQNIYVAIRAVDYEPDNISLKAGRRDQYAGDVVGVSFDSYFDHRTGFAFMVTAMGQKIDAVLTNPANSDPNWNAVWIVGTGMEDTAWVAEFEIPLNQLRYSKDEEQIWGFHCGRWIERLQEESDWDPQSSTGPGILYMFGELHGINGLPKSRRIEIMPYSFGRLKIFEKEPDNPFNDKGRNWLGNAGIDAKIGISSNFTADITLNPDFGQVESDPSVMNLTAFETFYEEKRPFFLEGRNIFSFDFENANLFYSRRIGHTPTYYPVLNTNETMKYPENATILSSVKFSGKSSKGLSVGILQSLTANQQAEIDSSGKQSEISVEPLTNYALTRVQKDFRQGNTVIGGIITSTNRFVNDPHLESLNRQAYTGGLDLLHQWKNKEFYIDARLVGSLIEGDNRAIINLQRSSARYYQRPDINYVQLDSSRTQLRGYGGSIRIGKGSVGLWRYFTEASWRSPGLELNDLGYLPTVDILRHRIYLSYFVNHPVSIFRSYSFSLNQNNSWDFGMRHLSSGINLNGYFVFNNKWTLSAYTNYTSRLLDTRILRGGSAMLVPAAWYSNLYIGTDPSKKVVFTINGSRSASNFKSNLIYSVQPGLTITPVNTLRISMSLNYSSGLNQLQYVSTKYVSNQSRYILGRLNQHTLGITFRIDYNITPELSIQYYGSPYASVGQYSDFKSVLKPLATEYSERFSVLNPTLNGSIYEVSENNDAVIDYTLMNPDFNFSQFRSNLVFRWEYRPGSQLYMVWSNERTNYQMPGKNSISDAIGNTKDVFPNNLFLIKFNYWFSL
jgi:hypothetical protein